VQKVSSCAKRRLAVPKSVVLYEKCRAVPTSSALHQEVALRVDSEYRAYFVYFTASCMFTHAYHMRSNIIRDTQDFYTLISCIHQQSVLSSSSVPH
jgi:hypothetical protein